MPGLDIAAAVLPVGMAALVPLWGAWTAYRGVSRASRVGSWVRMLAMVLIGVGLESIRRELGIEYGTIIDGLVGLATAAFDVAGGFL